MRPDTTSSPSATELVTVRHEAGVAHLELNRPEALNAWTPDLGRALLAAVRDASADPAVRAVLLTGAGRAFSAGADVKVPREHLPNGDIDLSVRLREIYNPIVAEIRAAPKPVVGAVQGAAAGLGCSLALSCDLLVASESAYFLLAFVHLGVIPDAGAALFLAEKVGSLRAAQLMMLGERLPAATARDWGLVTDVVPDAELRDTATALATRLAAGPTVALASMKRTLTSAAQSRLADHLELEATLQQSHATTDDYAEGVASFKEKRRPQFRGR
ncbi:1,2-epoxyphenylacetyl-CoA isomerase [Paraconexibacter sp. AEG42_29]|uniref:1,2-epoxyphenylacetyl-CoA isomerase n=1 Tax=Paraconexibacter sp. AEG42_29 TaxID=2997339 RepID=A0AAU7B1Y0_9ACTN